MSGGVRMRRFARLVRWVPLSVMLVLLFSQAASANSPAVVLGRGASSGPLVPADSAPHAVASLTLAAGTYWVTATAWLSQNTGAASPGYSTSCTLSTDGTDTD